MPESHPASHPLIPGQPVGSDPVPPAAGSPVEDWFARAFQRLDAVVAPLLRGRWWTLKVGAAALLLVALLQTPVRSFYTELGQGYVARFLAWQVAHPLTPFDPWQADMGGLPLEGFASHFDKVAFRLTVPVLGRLFGGGIYSWLGLSVLAGLAFYPVLAALAARLLGNRLTAAYVTFAFAASWAGGRFFNDNSTGDGLAWLLLLVSVTAISPVGTYAAVVAAAFTDERALVASGASFLFWTADLFPPRGPRPAADRAARLRAGAIALAWATYFGLRVYLGQRYGLRTGRSMLANSAILSEHLTSSLPYRAVCVFEGLWLWVLLGFVAVLAQRRWIPASALTLVFALLVGIALSVLDLERSLGYAVILLPVAWRLGGSLSAPRDLLAARLAFLVGVLLTLPSGTPLRYLRFWFT